MTELINEEHLNMIEQSLGRKPKGCYKVERVGSRNNPLVISVLPITEAKPFPTTYWLVSPELKKLISHIERDGFISTLEKEIASSEDLKEQLFENHRSYQNDRLELAQSLDEDAKSHFDQVDWHTSGIGGIRDWNHIKCLHLHFAHFLARDNLVGRIIEERFELLKHV